MKKCSILLGVPLLWKVALVCLARHHTTPCLFLSLNGRTQNFLILCNFRFLKLQNNPSGTERRLFFCRIPSAYQKFLENSFFCICDRKTWKGIHLKVSRFVLFFEVLTNAVLANDCGVELITLSRCLFGALVYISRAS